MYFELNKTFVAEGDLLLNQKQRRPTYGHWILCCSNARPMSSYSPLTLTTLK